MKKLAFVFFISMGNINPSWAVESEGTGAYAEWESAETILMHTPGEELFMGVAYPEPALFDETFDMDQAAVEHKGYIDALKEHGITVYTVTEALLKSDKKDLVDFARKSVKLNASRLKKADRIEQQQCFEENLPKLSPRVLVRLIMQRPTFKLMYATKPGERNHFLPPCKKYYIKADYDFDSVMNLYFTRDQMITTAKGVVLNRMSLPQRAVEVDIMEFVLKQLGITPIYRVQGKKSTLEGGDFISAGERVYIGEGLRTNNAAIKELLDNDVFGGRDYGVKEVLVVKDRWNNQQEMHLDTHFNVINEKLVVSVADRVDCRKDTSKCQLADVYQWQGEWRLSRSNVDFNDYLTNTVGARIIPVSVEDQYKYGINFLTIKDNNIIGVDGVSDLYKKTLEQAGVDAQWIDFTNMKLGFGAAHCTTQVLVRKPLH